MRDEISAAIRSRLDNGPRPDRAKYLFHSDLLSGRGAAQSPITSVELCGCGALGWPRAGLAWGGPSPAVTRHK